MDRQQLLQTTNLLDFGHPSLEGLIRERRWRDLPAHNRVGAIYEFVRDEIGFGYNLADDLPASRVLADGIGQCNTKGTLFMALLRGAGIPCRFHGFTIHKALQKGAITGVAYLLAPRDIIHSWVEVWIDGRWIELEGFILDKAYLASLQAMFPDHEGAFCGFGAATPDLHHPQIEWTGGNTYIQKDGIRHDFGVFDDPDSFYARHGANLTGARKWLFQNVVRLWMNANVARVRAGRAGRAAAGSR